MLRDSSRTPRVTSQSPCPPHTSIPPSLMLLKLAQWKIHGTLSLACYTLSHETPRLLHGPRLAPSPCACERMHV